MKAMSLFVTFTAMLICGECSAHWSRVDKDTIRLDGEIDRNSYASYQEASEGGYSTVILRSEGGSPMPALLIAKDMQRIQPNIVVNGYCLSACANYLFLASSAPRVECGAVIVWHGSPSGEFESNIEIMRLEGKSPKLVAAYKAWASRFEAMERDFFSSTGIDRHLLSDSEVVLRREKVSPESTFKFDEMTGDYSETTSAGMWIPTTDVMREYGIKVKNFCPSYDADIPKSLNNLGINAAYTSARP